MHGKGLQKKDFNLKRLIYETWNDVVLTPKDIIKFKDGDSTNLHYTNLIHVNGPNKHLNFVLDPKKKWKIFKNFDNYRISNYGDIFSIGSNKMFKPYLNPDGYYHIILMKNLERHDLLLHSVVYMTFKGDLPNGKVIDHKNQIKTDNFIGNLIEATYSENTLNIDPFKITQNIIHQYDLNNRFIKEWSSVEEIYNTLKLKNGITACCLGNRKQSHGFIWKYPAKILDTTGYKTIKTKDGRRFSNYKINKHGQIINRHNILMKFRNFNGYFSIKLKSDIDGKFYTYLVHRLVALRFIPNKNELYIKVNHIDKDKSNNYIDNLEWCTQKQNAIHAKGKKLNQIDVKTNKIINTFPSISEANRSINRRADSNGIRLVCTGKLNTSFGYKWAFVK